MRQAGGAWRFGAPEFVFGLVLAIGLVRGSVGFYNDPGTFWHVRLGREILATGRVPRIDTLTSTRAGTPWVDQSWLFDVGLAWLVDRVGWAGVTAAVALGLASIYRGLARWLIGLGNRPFHAAMVAIVAVGVGSIHFLARPHLFTFAFVLASLAACRAFHDRGSRLIWALPPMVALWANLHGGFLAGPVVVAFAMGGEAISGPWDVPRRRKLTALGAVLGLCLVAPLANPYGTDLYRHVIRLLHQSKVTDLIDEYKPAPFGREQARILEYVVLALIALPAFARVRADRYDLVPLLGWLHLALGSIRHAPLFAMAAAPVLARLIGGVSPEVDPWTDRRGGCAWPLLASGTLVAAILAGLPMGGPSPSHWPFEGLARLNREPVDARLFHEQDWGGLIELESRPRRRAYLDDRFELWGREPILEYVDALGGGPAWDALREREGIELVWVKPDRGLARRLLSDPGWRVVHRDATSILFRRGEGYATASTGR
jgi:hypothetical protein